MVWYCSMRGGDQSPPAPDAADGVRPGRLMRIQPLTATSSTCGRVGSSPTGLLVDSMSFSPWKTALRSLASALCSIIS